MKSALAAFGRHDLRTIRRDSVMVSVLLGPFLYAAIMWFLPEFTAFAARMWGFDLRPYHSVIISAFCVIGPALLNGAVLALQLLDDKDQHTLSVLRVTPIPPATYPAYRAAVAGVLAAVTTLASIALSGQVPASVLGPAAAVAVVTGVLAPVLGMLMASVARNKIEGLAVLRVVGMLVIPPVTAAVLHRLALAARLRRATAVLAGAGVLGGHGRRHVLALHRRWPDLQRRSGHTSGTRLGQPAKPLTHFDLPACLVNVAATRYLFKQCRAQPCGERVSSDTWSTPCADRSPCARSIPLPARARRPWQVIHHPYWSRRRERQRYSMLYPVPPGLAEPTQGHPIPHTRRPHCRPLL
ncbi:hypothetical protein AB0K48_33655, partial [Nonomuraea sp. NPDC055795]